MRIFFGSQKRAVNLARRFKQVLEATVYQRPISSVQHGFAKACGYHNWNELLQLSVVNGGATNFETMSALEAQSRLNEFSTRLAKALDVPASVMRPLVDRLRPFSGLPSIDQPLSDADILLMAQRLTLAAVNVSPFMESGFTGIKVSFKQRREEMIFAVNDIGELSQHTGFFEFDALMHVGGLWESIQTVDKELAGMASTVSPSPDILSLCRRLSRRALCIVRNAGCGSHFAYNAACRAPSDLVFHQLVRELPGISSLFIQLFDFEEPKADDHGLLGQDPVGGFCVSVMEHSKALWPELSISMDRMRSVVVKLLAQPTHRHWINKDVCAFLYHLPDQALPVTQDQIAAAVRFVDMSDGYFIDQNGPRLRPSDFCNGFLDIYRGDWKALNGGHVYPNMPLVNIGSYLLSAAAFEHGHHLYPGDFDGDDDLDEICRGVGAAVLEEQPQTYFTLVDELRAINQKAEQYEEQHHSHQWEAIAHHVLKSNLIHPHHREKTASLVLAELGFDIADAVKLIGKTASSQYLK